MTNISEDAAEQVGVRISPGTPETIRNYRNGWSSPTPPRARIVVGLRTVPVGDDPADPLDGVIGMTVVGMTITTASICPELNISPPSEYKTISGVCGNRVVSLILEFQILQ